MWWFALLWALGIFAARVVDVSMGTIRVQLIVRRRKYLAALIGFFEVLIFILIVSKVISDIGNWFNVVAYAAGFATGTLLGVTVAERMSRGIVEVTVITHKPWREVEQAVRQAGFALTRYSGVGREGRVDVLSAVCAAREAHRLLDAVTKADPRAFVYTQELAGLRGGHVYGIKGKLK